LKAQINGVAKSGLFVARMGGVGDVRVVQKGCEYNKGAVDES
jgi:hypothetical protein